MPRTQPLSDFAKWMLGIAGTLVVLALSGWVGSTEKRVQDHSVKIGVQDERYRAIQEKLNEISTDVKDVKKKVETNGKTD